MKKTTASVTVAALAMFCSCQAISRAPMGSPRIELEVAVVVDDSYTGKLQGVNEDFTRAVTDLVLSKADVGLRFYPVPSKRYGPRDPRPEYLLTVHVGGLDVSLDHRTVARQNSEPFIETFVNQLDCSVATSLTRRRKTGPALNVGSGAGHGWTGVKGAETPGNDSLYTLAQQAKDKAALTLSRADLLRVIDKALEPALAQLVTPVDRELAFRGAGAATKTPATPR